MKTATPRHLEGHCFASAFNLEGKEAAPDRLLRELLPAQDVDDIFAGSIDGYGGINVINEVKCLGDFPHAAFVDQVFHLRRGVASQDQNVVDSPRPCGVVDIESNSKAFHTFGRVPFDGPHPRIDGQMPTSGGPRFAFARLGFGGRQVNS